MPQSPVKTDNGVDLMPMKQNLNKNQEIIELKKKHENEVHTFADNNIFWAFEEKSFEDGMKKLGLEPTELDKITDIAGGAIRKDMVCEYNSLISRHRKEMNELKKTLRDA